MGEGGPGQGRKEQIVEAALALLADRPLDQLTTRRIARHLGVSQPSLFRHFRSREEIVLAVIAHTRTSMGVIAESILAELDEPPEQLEELACRVAAHIERNPGMPRLLFLLPEEGDVRTALVGLLNMLHSLVAELVREGQRRGAFSAAIPPEHAATLFVGLVQGIALRANLEQRTSGLESEARALLALWMNGMRADAGAPSRSGAPTEGEPSRGGIAAIDVRPTLARGLDPLGEVLGALAELAPGAVLVITAPFRPGPLLALLQCRGHGVRAREVGPDTWVVHVVVGGGSEIEELTDLEPPEPLERVLLAAARLRAGQTYIARLPRYPRLLIERLQEMAQPFAVHEEVDGTALVRVWRDER